MSVGCPGVQVPLSVLANSMYPTKSVRASETVLASAFPLEAYHLRQRTVLSRVKMRAPLG